MLLAVQSPLKLVLDKREKEVFTALAPYTLTNFYDICYLVYNGLSNAYHWHAIWISLFYCKQKLWVARVRFYVVFKIWLVSPLMGITLLVARHCSIYYHRYLHRSFGGCIMLVGGWLTNMSLLAENVVQWVSIRLVFTPC